MHTCSTFVENVSPTGIVAVSYSALEFSGINNFSNNAGRAIQVRPLPVTKIDVVIDNIFTDHWITCGCSQYNSV